MRTRMETLSKKNGITHENSPRNDKIRMYMLHEIKNPVTLMNSIMQLMEKESPELKNNTRWECLNREMDHLIRLLNDYSALHRRPEIKRTCLNLIELITHTLSGFEAMASRKKTALRFLRTPETSGRWYESYPCDRVKLEEVLQNLIKNALEAAPENGFVTVEIHPAHHGYLSISITNNGPAIPSGILPHIFEPFYTTKDSGTGIGLALSKKITEAHGGRLTVISNSEKTCFTIYLPIKH